VEAAYAAERGFDGEAQQLGTADAPAPTITPRRRRNAALPLLDARGLRKTYGGINAVTDVSLHVRTGETLGLIGPNGAGKTTTFELLAGFVTPDGGSVRFDGEDVTELSPEARAQLGLIRSFQDASLFPTLTVIECVQLALERIEPTHLMTSLLGFKGAEARKAGEAAELIAWMGLERYRSSQIQELSTGTRRITELACLVALQPRLLLLDEPSSGIAQRETEALGGLLRRLKDELDLTLVIIEHDIPLIVDLADRIVCMADGSVLAEGPPDLIRNDPAVVEAYLGGSLAAIERSGRTGPRKRTA
jgi:ABC-type branched-subunit amino acid transport system ATPase component